MRTFQQYLENLVLEVGPGAPASPGGLAAPASIPPGGGGPPMGGGMPPPPMGGPGGLAPPMGGGLGGPPMGGPMGAPGMPGQQQPATKLKAYNVWDVLEKVLSDNPTSSGNKNLIS
jgi:hypothetical protein